MVFLHKYVHSFNLNAFAGKYFFRAVVFSLTILVGGCFFSKDGSKSKDQAFVTVNSAVLTESVFKSLVPDEVYGRLGDEQKKEIVKDWVNNELLYQEALRRDIDKDPYVMRILENTRQNLLRNELLEKVYVKIQSPDEKALKDFYGERKDYFILVNDEYKVRFALFETENDAKEFWKKVKGGEPFTRLAQETSKTLDFQIGGETGIVSRDMVEPAVSEEVIRTINELGLVKISEPFAVVDGWMCLIIDEVYKQGTVLPFDAVHDQVLDMYMVEKRQEARDAYLEDLRKKASIKYGSLY